MNKIKIRDGYEPFYIDSLSKAFRQQSNNGNYSQKQIIDEIKLLNKKIEQARDFLITGAFTNTDFQAVKAKCEKEISTLEKKLPDIIHTSRIIDKLLENCIYNLKKLNTNHKSLCC